MIFAGGSCLLHYIYAYRGFSLTTLVNCYWECIYEVKIIYPGKFITRVQIPVNSISLSKVTRCMSPAGPDPTLHPEHRCKHPLRTLTLPPRQSRVLHSSVLLPPLRGGRARTAELVPQEALPSLQALSFSSHQPEHFRSVLRSAGAGGVGSSLLQVTVRFRLAAATLPAAVIRAVLMREFSVMQQLPED